MREVSLHLRWFNSFATPGLKGSRREAGQQGVTQAETGRVGPLAPLRVPSPPLWVARRRDQTPVSRDFEAQSVWPGPGAGAWALPRIAVGPELDLHGASVSSSVGGG